MPRYDMGADLEPTADEDRLTHIAEAYEASERFDADAWEWVCDNPDAGDIAIARQRYAESPKFADVVADINDGEVTL